MSTITTHTSRQIRAVEHDLHHATIRLRDTMSRTLGLWEDTARDPEDVRELRDVLHGCEDRVFVHLARLSPVGRNLRRLVSAIRVARRLERAAALTGHVIGIRSQIDSRCLQDDMVGRVEHLGLVTVGLLTASIHVRVDRDWRLAQRLHREDDVVDDLAARIQASDVQPPTLGVLARHHERIADHAVGIADEVVLVHTGRRRSERRCRASADGQPSSRMAGTAE